MSEISLCQLNLYWHESIFRKYPNMSTNPHRILQKLVNLFSEDGHMFLWNQWHDYLYDAELPAIPMN